MMHLKKRTIIISLIVILLILVAALILYHNSYRIALKVAGFSDATFIDSGFDDDGKEYRAVFSYLPMDNQVRCALFTKDSFGIWRITHCECGPESESDIDCFLRWDRVASVKRYAVDDANVFEKEIHFVVGGNDAIKQVEIPYDLLPPNVSVNVFQAGSLYVLHFAIYGEEEILEVINVTELLNHTNSVEP